MTLLKRATLTATIATLLLVAIGASVRASGSGLGCPDWPKCFGHWIPPTNAADLPPGFEVAQFNLSKTWTEYLNRLAGIVVGFLILTAALLGLRKGDHHREVKWGLLAALLLTGFQGWQGGQVVKRELDPRWVTVHLVTAVFIVGLLVRASFGLLWPQRRPKATSTTSKMDFLIRAVSGLVFAQIVLGALVRGTVDLVASENPALAKAERLAEVGFIDHLHRQVGLASFLLIVGLFVWNRRGAIKDPVLSRALTTALFLGLVQVAIGLGLAYAGLPAFLQVAHIGVAVVLLSALYVGSLATRRPA